MEAPSQRVQSHPLAINPPNTKQGLVKDYPELIWAILLGGVVCIALKLQVYKRHRPLGPTVHKYGRLWAGGCMAGAILGSTT